MVIFKHELKMNLKSLLIWSVCVGFTCFGCLILFGSLEESIEEMAGAYSNMGALSTAIGLDKISIATIEGFYATEIGLIFAIGGAMFAAMTAVVMLAKEEEGHTAEFLYTLPLGRGRVAVEKYAAMLALVLLFNGICILWSVAGFVLAGDLPPGKEFGLYHAAQLLMQLEVGSVCFLISAVSRKKQVGAALGFAVFLYVMDLVCRLIPDMENLKYVTPYYFSNAADIFTEKAVDQVMAGIGAVVLVVSAVAAFGIYTRRDLMA
ncbi:ABC transporter permease subunit [Roseburia hominis]